MAERNQDRSYSTARNGHGADQYEPGHRESDPLTELARLIGHTDPLGAAEEHADAHLRAAPRQAQHHGYQQEYGQDYPRVQDDPLEDGPLPEEEPEEHAAPAGPPQWIQRANLRREAIDHTHGQLDTSYQDEPAYLDDPDAYRAGYAEDGADEEAPTRRRPMYLVAGILALAVVGTAGAYGYRTYFGAPRGEPPIIKADNSPTKIPAPSDDAKQPDRLASNDGTEKIVPREEQPVDVDASAAGPRGAFPPLNQNPAPSVPQQGEGQAAAPVDGTLPNGEPRKVRTVAVPGDQSDGAPAPPQTFTGDGVGGYLVQVSSQRNEAEAQASFKAMQSKYPSVLGSQKAAIKRADLGEKGTYYRAMIGPFGTSEEATQFCGNLKTAGGQCIVRHD